MPNKNNYVSRKKVKTVFLCACIDFLKFDFTMPTGKGHLREAVLSHEEALRVHDLCKQMRKIDLFRDILQKMHERLD